jgi:peptidoglycan/xylan/chitin deacetylase (PgdA/CDA1 family)
MSSVIKGIFTSLSYVVFFSLVSLAPTQVQADVASHANILLYHHVATDTPHSTSVTPKVFAQHMAYIAKHFTVLPLNQIVDAIQHQQPLPNNTIAITFDDGYANIYANAHPILRQYKMPYTIFINPDVIGEQANQLTWQQVNAMQKEGVLFGNHTLNHLHMLDRKKDETDDQWLARVWQNVEDAEAMLANHTGVSLKYLAYPFGEFNKALADRLREHHYIGFGQHSGAVGMYSDLAALPRFPAAGHYANLETLKTKMASLPMPVVKNSLSNPELSANVLTSPISLDIKDPAKDVRLSQANCFYQGEVLDVKTTTTNIEFTLDAKLPVGRSRVNCTAPSNSLNGRFYWYSQPFFIAREDGTYPN